MKPVFYRRRRAWRFARAADGATAVEFALIAPVLVLFLVGIMEFGVYFWKKHSIEFAVEETSRSIMMKSSISSEAVTTDLKGRLSGVDPAELTATVTQETVGTTTFVAIAASHTHAFVIGGMMGFESILIESKSRVPLSPAQ